MMFELSKLSWRSAKIGVILFAKGDVERSARSGPEAPRIRIGERARVSVLIRRTHVTMRVTSDDAMALICDDVYST